MTETQLTTIRNAPGMFTTDDARTRIWPYNTVQDKNNGTSPADLNKAKTTDSFFLPGSYNFKGDGLKWEDDRVWHIQRGARDAVELGTDKVDKYNKMNGWYGWQKLFSAHAHDPERGNERSSNSSSSSNGRNTWNYQYWTNNQEAREQGVLLGSNDINHCLQSTARWSSPIGFQFKWHNYHNHNMAARMRISQLWLIFTDIWAPSRALYAPIVRDGRFTNSKSFTRGVDIVGRSSSAQEKLASYHYSGEFVGFVDEDSMDIIKDRYTVSACIGLHHRDEITKFNGGVFPKWRSWWDCSFLWTDDYMGSEIIIPQPHNLRERMEDRKIKLL